jgi:pyruvate kinase
MKQIKIIATIGPASDKPETLNQLVKAGANIFRLNLKHNQTKWHQEKIDWLQSQNLTVMVDLPSVDSLIELKNFDMLALSHVKTALDIKKVKDRLETLNESTVIIAKIEEQKAIDNLDEIIEVADGIMVARGDLGRNTPIEKLGVLQKQIIDQARNKYKPVIVATEMLLSMTQSEIPSRAEANDVTNAVYDGADCLMLSEETAIGKYPIRAVETMKNIASFTEIYGQIKQLAFNPINSSDHILAAAENMLRDKELKINKVVVFSKSGRSARILSSFRCLQPIMAIVDNKNIFNQLNLGFGLVPYQVDNKKDFLDKIANKSDKILLIHGNNWLETGSINSLSIREY